MARGAATAQKAHELANAVSRRLESRFMTGGGARDLPGICLFISSKKAETDYLDQRIGKVKGLPGVHVVDGPLWEFNEKIRYSGKTFRVLLGDATHDAQVLDAVDYSGNQLKVAPVLSTYEEARLEGKIIDVPIEHYKAFQEDIIGAIRDVAGISTSATVNFFPRKKVIKDMMDTGKEQELPKYFKAETIIMPIRTPVKLTQQFDLNLACGVRYSQRFPYRHSRAPRYVHVDLARNTDAVGIVMVHPSEFHVSEREEVQGTAEESVEKNIEVDLVIRIKTDDSGEDVDFKKIVEFITWLRRNGFWIRRATYDSYQSAGSIQDLKTFGIDAGVRSVDKTVLPYKILRRVMGDRRIACPPHSILEEELGTLVYHTETDKVDHPEGGSKDCSDALAAAVYECVVDKLTPADLPPISAGRPSSEFDDYLEDLTTLRREMF
jgi:hypothetical protein